MNSSSHQSPWLSATTPYLKVLSTRAFTYRVPKGLVGQGATNYVVELRGVNSENEAVIGLGEGQPRGARTGDLEGSWAFLEEAVQKLEGAFFYQPGAEDSVAEVRHFLSSLFLLAERRSTQVSNSRPYRGALQALDAAILDIVARAQSRPLADLIGRQRDEAPASPPPLRVTDNLSRVQKVLKDQALNFERTRILGVESTAETLEFLKFVSSVNSTDAVGRAHKPLWINFNGKLNPDEALSLIRDLLVTIDARLISPNIALERLLPEKNIGSLGRLQEEADSLAKRLGREDIDVRILTEDLNSEPSPTKAINIRPARLGGLLASMDIAAAALRQDPSAKIFLSRMNGASELTSSALRHLALGLPRIDAATVSSAIDQKIPLTAVHGELLPSGRAEPEADEESVPEVRDPVDEDDDGEENHAEEELGFESESGSDAPDDDDQDEADPRDSSDPGSRMGAHRFSVRSAPGIGLTLNYSSLVSEVLKFVTFPQGPVAKNRGYEINTFEDSRYLMPLGMNGTKGHLLERESLARGLSTVRFSKGVFIANDGNDRHIGFRWSRSDLSSATAHALCGHKESTRARLQARGVPVPMGRTFRNGDHETARAYADTVGFPLVIKPASGMKGIGVTSNIQSMDDFDEALTILVNSKMGSDDFIVEQHAEGDDYRIMVVGDEVVAAIVREPAAVTGDGVHTVAELMIDRNTVRRANPHLWKRPLRYDDAAKFQLRRSGYTLDSIPAAGALVQIANSSSLSQGGESIEVTDELHPTIKEACVKAVQAIPGLYFCGVDFLLKDHSQPLTPENGKIIELNAIPAVGNCEYPFFGKPRQVASRLISECVSHFNLDAFASRADELSINIEVRGKVTKVGYRRWLKKHADRFGVVGWVKNSGPRRVEAELHGSTEAVSALATLAIFGPNRAVPTSVTTSHVEGSAAGGFEILSEVGVDMESQNVA